MNTELLMQILTSMATAMGLAISIYVIPLLKSKLTQSQIEQLTYYAEVGVRCAEQIYPKEKRDEKKSFVMDYVTMLMNDKLNISLSRGQIEAIVEACVNEIKNG